MPRWIAVVAYDQDLNVHHASYARLGCEVDADLEALCRRCHEIETFGESKLHRVATRPCVECENLIWGVYSALDDGLCSACEMRGAMDYTEYHVRKLCEQVQ